MAKSPPLEDIKVPTRLKLSAVWASLMFCYIYGDYFGLYQPGNLRDMLNGQMGPLGPTTQGVLLGTAALMALPSLMVFLSLALPVALSRWFNIVLGAARRPPALSSGSVWSPELL